VRSFSLGLERVLGAVARRGESPAGRLLRIAPVRCALHRRAVRAWRATDEPLIVCFGNINRSPFAAQLARRRAGSRARSGGFYPQAGRCSPPGTVAGARAYEVDLSAHRSVVVDDAALARAPAIFVFDLQNLASVAARWPRALRRTHLVGALAEEGSLLIADPHGRGTLVLEQVLAQIATAIEHADRGDGDGARAATARAARGRG